ncbi:glycosyltransferase family 4 protein [Gonapodya prolifera JEL478]|uniref:GDP-Man:Man(3)GlcNAc(2)-PP-Dol alpha-1,2-mannosyltransferase n=1 Tax=Gonapodya prolifera (strain JEL478) TaxID=1344416 RepID=A0A139ARI1_GONPJ|nr:glycosyltransferase family 4 protein [Gonapodya prolifera JEL478]|eukprot:KXS19347.1 glycosyltransferase family 4 protein [Gonapodya prolifera JEL478]
MTPIEWCLSFLLGTIALALLRSSWQRNGSRNAILAFFHPNADAGGGGERVLWVSVKALATQHPNCKCVIYTRDVGLSADEILERVKVQFDITLSKEDVDFVWLKQWRWILAERYPTITLMGQSLGSLVPAYEALWKLRPDVFIDTTGFAFTLVLAKYGFGCRTIAYVHYPTVSKDMLRKVENRVADYSNSSTVTSSVMLSRVKLQYYRFFASLYSLAGSSVDHAMVNSTWTKNHIDSLWNIPQRTSLVYPPCNVGTLATTPLEGREPKVVSVAQFRPEKAHMLQVEAFALARRALQERGVITPKLRLVLIGGCRHEGDWKLVDDLKQRAIELAVVDNIDFIINAEYSRLLSHLKNGLIGLHTMTEEHFGIGIVEYMAAGLVAIAHDSGGPKTDIVIEHNGTMTGMFDLTYECD